MIEISLHVTAEFLVIFVLGADHATRLALIVGNDAAHKYTAVSLGILGPQFLGFLAIHQPVEIDRGGIEVLNHELGCAQEHIAPGIESIPANNSGLIFSFGRRRGQRFSLAREYVADLGRFFGCFRQGTRQRYPLVLKRLTDA